MTAPLLGTALCGCGVDDDVVSHSDPPTGSVALAAVGAAHDVVAMRFRIVEPGGTNPCSTNAVVGEERVIGLESETLGESLGGGDGHRFSDALYILAPGDYVACAEPLSSLTGSPSLICDEVDKLVTVVAEQTVEHVLISQCDDGNSGGLDVVVALNEAPVIEDISVVPSKFVKLCESSLINVTASDPEGDPLTYDWTVTMQPAGADALTAAGSSATFAPDVVGEYEITLTVSDPHGRSDTVVFPMHGEPGACAPSGSVDWMLTGGTIGAEQVRAVAVAPDQDVIVAGEYTTNGFGLGAGTVGPPGGGTDIFVARLDPYGNVQWQRGYGGASGDQKPNAIAVDGEGDIFIAAWFASDIDFGCGAVSGSFDIAIAKLDGNDGSCIWSHTFGGPFFDGAEAIVVDDAGDVIVGGRFSSASMQIPGGSLLTNASAGDDDAWLVKRDGTTGAAIWDASDGAAGADAVNALDVNNAGDLFVTGHRDGHLIVRKRTAGTANIVWTRTPSLSSGSYGYGLAVDPAGDVIISGLFQDGAFDLGGGAMSPPGTKDVFVARLSGNTGAHDWSVQGFSTVTATRSTVAVDAAGDVRVAGTLPSGSLDFGGSPIVAMPTQDVFVVALSGLNGAERWNASGTSAGGTEQAGGVAVDALGYTIFGGHFGFSGASDFTFSDSSAVDSLGSYDVFITKLRP